MHFSLKSTISFVLSVYIYIYNQAHKRGVRETAPRACPFLGIFPTSFILYPFFMSHSLPFSFNYPLAISGSFLSVTFLFNYFPTFILALACLSVLLFLFPMILLDNRADVAKRFQALVPAEILPKLWYGQEVTFRPNRTPKYSCLLGMSILFCCSQPPKKLSCIRGLNNKS